MNNIKLIKIYALFDCNFDNKSIPFDSFSYITAIFEFLIEEI